MKDWLHYFPQANEQAIRQTLDARAAWVGQEKKGFLRYRNIYTSLCHLRASDCDFQADTVRIGRASDLSAEEQERVYQGLRGFMPWRKGPFSVFGTDIDAEWRSERKWARLLAELPDLRGKVIADIGCNNGYYLFRMAAHQPALALGFEPFVQHYYTFGTLNAFAGQKNLVVELLGIEDIGLFPESFDCIFCLGILYHRPSPISALQDLHRALKPGGVLLVESQAIPGEDPVALFPEKTYAKVPGTWFVPTASCLHNWLLRSKFTDVRLFCEHDMSKAEQRRTDWMHFESYEDFIDKQHPHLTVEGYPAPRRIFFRAKK